MDKRTKAWMQLIIWIILLLLILWIPEFGVIVLIGMVAWFLYKKVRGVPVVTLKKRKR